MKIVSYDERVAKMQIPGDLNKQIKLAKKYKAEFARKSKIMPTLAKKLELQRAAKEADNVLRKLYMNFYELEDMLRKRLVIQNQAFSTKGQFIRQEKNMCKHGDKTSCEDPPVYSPHSLMGRGGKRGATSSMRNVHAVQAVENGDNVNTSLCGKKPGGRSLGWHQVSSAINCPECLKHPGILCSRIG